MFQFFNLVPMLTAVENVSLPLVLDGMRARTADARAEELLERVGLGDRARHRPAELSGGQMQRVAVARALVARPSIILADEPTGNLDSHSSTEVLDLLRSLSDEDGATVVMVTHDQAAARYGSRELHLVDGRASASRERLAHRAVVMQRLRAGWLSFRRIHLAALIADWRRTLLSVIGVALGVTIVLGVLILKSELARPFDSFGPSLTHAADVGVLEVTPNVSGRLPIETVDRLRAEVTGAEAVIPIVAGLTPVDVAGGSHENFMLGGSCQIELLVGPFNCEQRARGEKPPAGPGVPLADSGRHRPAAWPQSSATSCAFPAFLQVRRTWVGHSRTSIASKASTTATCC